MVIWKIILLGWMEKTMTDHNLPEEVSKRANQEDPIIMYLIVRESLNMSIGKTAAQCAHASQMLLLNHFDLMQKDHCGWASIEEKNITTIFTEWLDTSFRKVVLKADEKEWIKLKTQLSKEQFVVVVDVGLTELAPQTETVIGIIPMRKSEAPKLIKRLQVLK